MSHQDFQELIDDLAEDFDAADEALTDAAIAALEGKISAAEAEGLIAGIVADLQRRSSELAASVMPAVVLDAQQEADRALGTSGAAGDEAAQSAVLELASEELEEALHNTAEQMGRDARRQIREGLRIQMEEESAGVGA